MASLIAVCQLLALQGRMDARQLSVALKTSRPLMDAMLARLETMGKVVRFQENTTGCLSGHCQQCPQGKSACQHEWWLLR